MGLRDYAMFLLIATYGLRASEVVAISLDDIRWRHSSLRIHQRKTSSPLELPLTKEVSAALVKHLQRTPPTAPYRRIFLRMRAPIGLLKPTAVTEAFKRWCARADWRFLSMAHIAFATHLPSSCSRPERRSRQSETSWAIALRKAHRCIYGSPLETCVRSRFQFLAGCPRAKERSDD